MTFVPSRSIIRDIHRYAKFIVERGFVCNTLGTIAVREKPTRYSGTYVIYTKRKGVSLEEMDPCGKDIVVTDGDGALVYGDIPPSIGHKLNLEIFRHRPDTNAVIHLHVDEIIALCTVLYAYKERLWHTEATPPKHAAAAEQLPFISDDAPLVLERPILVLEKRVNVEVDAALVKDFIPYTNCFVMPNHGVTSLGENVSQAYHRMCTAVAESRRLLSAHLLASATRAYVPRVPKDEVEKMFEIGRDLIYGNAK